jgi:hypothetical protein
MFYSVNPRKAPGYDLITGQILKVLQMNDESERIWKETVCHNSGTLLEFAWRNSEEAQNTSFI